MPFFNLLIFSANIFRSPLLDLNYSTELKGRTENNCLLIYVNYSKALKSLCGNNDLIQWVDGSFVTKAPKPKDIDLVTFINFEVISSLGNALQLFKYPESEIFFQVDAYIVPLYAIGHPRFYLTQLDKAIGLTCLIKLEEIGQVTGFQKAFWK